MRWINSVEVSEASLESVLAWPQRQWFPPLPIVLMCVLVVVLLWTRTVMCAEISWKFGADEAFHNFFSNEWMRTPKMQIYRFQCAWNKFPMRRNKIVSWVLLIYLAQTSVRLVPYGDMMYYLCVGGQPFCALRNWEASVQVGGRRTQSSRRVQAPILRPFWRCQWQQTLLKVHIISYAPTTGSKANVRLFITARDWLYVEARLVLLWCGCVFSRDPYIQTFYQFQVDRLLKPGQNCFDTSRCKHVYIRAHGECQLRYHFLLLLWWHSKTNRRIISLSLLVMKNTTSIILSDYVSVCSSHFKRRCRLWWIVKECCYFSFNW